jgi:hypothetical protein
MEHLNVLKIIMLDSDYYKIALILSAFTINSYTVAARRQIKNPTISGRVNISTIHLALLRMIHEVN